MGRELQKRKRRSSRPAVKQHTSTKSTKRLLNPRGNDLIAKNWDKKQTTTQNYRRLGLVGRLKAPTGGAEPEHKKLAAAREQAKSATTTSASKKAADPFAIAPATEGVVSEVRVERDAEGRIVRILDDPSSSKKAARPNPLNDPLNAFDSGSEDGEDEDEEEEPEAWGGIDDNERQQTEIVQQLEAQANRPREKRTRMLSQREREWLARLVEKHGDDVRAMAWDRALNPMQQTEADLARRIRKWKGEAS